jgi:serine O-acetyltransferase
MESNMTHLQCDNFFSEIKQDLIANGWDNKKLGTALRLMFLGLGVQLLICYRIQVRLLRIPVVGRFLSRFVSYFAQVLTGCQISSTAVLKGGINFPHPNGIVIGENVIVASGTSIYQQVTLGLDKNGNYPDIGHCVTIFPGAKVLGGICLGDNSTVGANAVVNADVAAGTVVAGVPARVIKKNA